MINSIESLSVGMSATSKHTITDETINTFAKVSGDHNPIHLDDDFATASKFGKRIAHGALVSSFFSALFASELPGAGAIYVAQNTRFIKPVFIEDTVIAEVKITHIDVPKHRVYFSTICYVNDVIVLSGDAEIYMA